MRNASSGVRSGTPIGRSAARRRRNAAAESRAWATAASPVVQEPPDAVVPADDRLLVPLDALEANEPDVAAILVQVRRDRLPLRDGHTPGAALLRPPVEPGRRLGKNVQVPACRFPHLPVGDERPQHGEYGLQFAARVAA